MLKPLSFFPVLITKYSAPAAAPRSNAYRSPPRELARYLFPVARVIARGRQFGIRDVNRPPQQGRKSGLDERFFRGWVGVLVQKARGNQVVRAHYHSDIDSAGIGGKENTARHASKLGIFVTIFITFGPFVNLAAYPWRWRLMFMVEQRSYQRSFDRRHTSKSLGVNDLSHEAAVAGGAREPKTVKLADMHRI